MSSLIRQVEKNHIFYSITEKHGNLSISKQTTATY